MFKAAFEETYSDASDRFDVAWLWALIARRFRHSSMEAAYQNGMSVMQSSLAVGPTVQTQHTILGNLGQKMRMPLEYASYLIERGQLGLAIETLEQGRALLWSEMQGLSTSIDQLRRVHHTLADKFMAVSKDLEVVAMSVSPSQSSHEDRVTLPDTAGVHEEMDTFTRILQEQRRLMQERQAIVSQIRAMSGFEHFLTAVPYPSDMLLLVDQSSSSITADGAVTLSSFCAMNPPLSSHLHTTLLILMRTSCAHPKGCFSGQ